MEEIKYKDQIDKFKAVGRNTHTVTCESGETALFLEPTIVQSAPVLAILMSGEPDLIKAGGKIFESCWVAGDDKIRTDEELKAEVCLALVNLAKIKTATVKKN
jgi:hypothetical protein